MLIKAWAIASVLAFSSFPISIHLEQWHGPFPISALANTGQDSPSYSFRRRKPQLNSNGRLGTLQRPLARRFRRSLKPVLCVDALVREILPRNLKLGPILYWRYKRSLWMKWADAIKMMSLRTCFNVVKFCCPYGRNLVIGSLFGQEA